MKFARMNNGKAVEVIDFDPNGAFTHEVAQMFESVPEDTGASDTRSLDGTWTKYVAPVVVVDPEPSPPRYISVGAFFDRFGAEKWPILASTDPLVQALVKDCTVRISQGINLDRPDVAGGVALLQSKGFTSVTAAVITDPILESEKP